MKYTITMGCGHEDTVVLFGSSSERERKIEYYKTQGLCKDCYKKKMEEESLKQKFTFKVAALPYVCENNGNVLLEVWFGGNTKPYIDEIKSLGGYHWSVKETADDLFPAKRPSLCWNKIIEETDLKEEIKKAKSIGAELVEPDKGFLSSINYEIAKDLKKEWKEKTFCY